MGKRSQKAKQPPTGRIIKRYGNRKLYDTQQSRYVTLEEISRMVRKGEDFRVIDNKTQEDLTSVTLAQIMLEREKSTKNAYPLNLLRDLIQQGGESITDWVQKGRESFVTIKLEGKEQISRILEKGHETTEEGALLLKEWFTQQQRAIDLIQKKIDERIKDFVSHLTGLDELEKQIVDLENKISRLEKKVLRNNGQ